jgi:cell division protein FtsB
MGGQAAMEHHDRSVQVPHVSPFARRVALVVAVLAALLAISEVYAENRIAKVITAETQLAHLNGSLEVDQVKAAIAKTPSREAEIHARIAPLETSQHAAELAHERLELAIVFLQIGIVLASISALLGIVYLLGLGGALGAAGAVMLVLGLAA